MKYGEFMRRLDELRVIEQDQNAPKAQRLAAKRDFSAMFACLKANLNDKVRLNVSSAGYVPALSQCRKADT